VRYWLGLPIGGACADARTLAKFATLAEQAGWDGLFLEDYIVYGNRQDMPTYDPWVVLAAMAMSTERIRLGTGVTPLARRRPWKLAREAVTLDHLSGGRLTLGIGLGALPDISFTHFDEETDTRKRAEMLDEALDILAGLWSGQPFSYEGTHYRLREVTFLPRPLQSPRIPIWIGGAYPNPGPLRRAARWDGACFYKAVAIGSAEDDNQGLTPGDVRAIKRFVEQQRPLGSPFDIVAGGPSRGIDREHLRARHRALADAGATWLSQWIPPSDAATMRAAIALGPVRID